MNQNVYDLPVSHEVVGKYSLTRGVELFLVGSEMVLKRKFQWVFSGKYIGISVNNVRFQP